MSSTINADTSDGLKFTSDTSGEIKLQSAGTDTVTVKSDGKVGIGTTSPTYPLTVSTSSGAQGLKLTSTNTGTLGPDLTLEHDSSSPADGDIISLISFKGNDSGGTSTTYGQIRAVSDDVTDATENGSLQFLTTVGATLAERMRIAASGNVYIETTTSAPTGNGFAFDTATNGYSYMDIAHESGAGTSGSYVRFYYGGAQIGRIAGASASSVAYVTTSDYRLKENNVSIDNGIDRVKLLKPYRFNFIAEPDNVVDGFYAHEVQSVVPEAVVGTKDEVDAEGNPEYQGIDQSKLVPLLTAALQEAITKIEDLETRIQALENA